MTRSPRSHTRHLLRDMARTELYHRTRQVIRLRRHAAEDADRGHLVHVFHIERDSIDEKAGTFRAVLATDSYLPSLFGPVKLSHDAGAAKLPKDAPILIGHDTRSLPVGRWSGFAVRNGKTRATGTIGSRHRETIFRDIAEGVITDVSVGADVELADLVESEDNPGAFIARSWTLAEASLVGLGKDGAAGVNRSRVITRDGGDDDPARVTALQTIGEQRATEIRALFDGLEGSDWLELRVAALEGSESIDIIRTRVIDRLKAQGARQAPAPAGSDRAFDVRIDRDAIDKFRDGFAAALAFKTGLTDPEKERETLAELRRSEYLSMTLMDVARHYLRLSNVDTAGLHRDQIAHRALFTRAGDGFAGYAPGDLTNVLAGNVNMALGKGYDEAEESWPMFTGRDQNSDFRTFHRPVVSAFSDLTQVIGTGEYTYGDISDKEETGQIETWGKLFGIGRQAIVNDTLGIFGRVPRAMGRAASRKVGDQVFTVLNLTSTYTMNEDSVALFHAATHSNYVGSGSGAAPSVSTLNAGRTAMATQTDPQSVVISVRPRWLLLPEALATTGEVLVAAAMNPATASGVEPMPGWIGRLQPISDRRIDADVATAWYLLANQAVHDTVVVAFLDGISTPMIEQHEADPSRDGIIYKVRHDFDAYAGDWRTMYCNYGA